MAIVKRKRSIFFKKHDPSYGTSSRVVATSSCKPVKFDIPSVTSVCVPEEPVKFYEKINSSSRPKVVEY
jgi:hypothetical protein